MLEKIFLVNNTNISHQFENTCVNYKLYKIKIKEKNANIIVLNLAFERSFIMPVIPHLMFCSISLLCCYYLMKYENGLRYSTKYTYLLLLSGLKNYWPGLDNNVEISEPARYRRKDIDNPENILEVPAKDVLSAHSQTCSE